MFLEEMAFHEKANDPSLIVDPDPELYCGCGYQSKFLMS
jgi:hypothetical protein